MSDALALQSRETIRQGSKSFAKAAALFDPATRTNVEMLYAWCRWCDDTVDGQTLGHQMAAPSPAETKALLEGLYRDTRAALAGEPPSQPVFAAFQQVARATRLPERFPLEHLDGFAMDADERRYATIEDVLDYCWHVAGVVGVMMAVVMGVSPDETATLQRAQDLGLAFQLTNIARDVIEDAQNGRVYLPAAWLAEAGVADAPAAVADPANRAAVAGVARRLVETAEPYYASARWGLRSLPGRSAWAIAAALGVYRQIGLEVQKRGPRAWDSRVVVSDGMKTWRALQGGLIALRGATLDRWSTPPARPALWSKV